MPSRYETASSAIHDTVSQCNICYNFFFFFNEGFPYPNYILPAPGKQVNIAGQELSGHSLGNGSVECSQQGPALCGEPGDLCRD